MRAATPAEAWPSAASLYEAAGRRGALPDRIRPLRPGSTVRGPAYTVRVGARDNLWIHRGIYAAEPGDVLVVACEGDPEAGYWGELMTRAGLERGLAGVVLDAGVRDSEAIAALGLPIFASRVSLGGTDKDPAAPGGLGEGLTLGAAFVEPGDWIVGDADGVVALPRDRAEEIRVAAVDRERRERAQAEAIAAGERLLDLLGIR